MPKVGAQARHPGARATPVLAFGAIGAAVVARVVAEGWVSDDAMITFRYARNLVDGYGPVFNVGERVQGYTHPLWLLVLSLASLIYDDAVYLSVVLGAGFTLATFAVLAHALTRLAGDWRAGLLLTALLGGLFASSEAWVSFQTSGLENSLSHLLLALLVAMVASGRRPALPPLAALCSLLVLTRPDFALLVAPLALAAAWERRRDPRELALSVAACAPLFAWLAFAWAYYGAPYPNTASAKLGIYPDLGSAIDQGLRYLADWARYEPAPVMAAAFLGVVGAALARGSYPRLLALGAALYVAYVVLIGGDFMRGRFLLPSFVVAALLGAFALAPRLRRWPLLSRPLGLGVAIFGIAIACGAWQALAPAQDRDVGANGIVNERLFYDGFDIWDYRRTGRLTLAEIDVTAIAATLKGFAAQCGPFAIHWGTPGTLGYLTGPEVSLIDTIGLTDEYISRLSRSALVISPPRPGHPYRYIPVSYLASRGDIALVPGWWERAEAGDCSLLSEPAKLAGSRKVFDVFSDLILDPPPGR
ncbi:MAG TPA: hypothetical protein VNN10_15445 [Dehalococcoidia bacterium]|nr:hypothetical protein [Dehalococcoidia bacterium]